MVAQMNTSAKGDRNELEIMRPFKDAGYKCDKARMSRGLWDRKAEWTENSNQYALYFVLTELGCHRGLLWMADASEWHGRDVLLAIRSGKSPYFSPAEKAAMRKDNYRAGAIKLLVKKHDGSRWKPVRWELEVLT